MYKIKCFGYRGSILGQIDRIEKGFLLLGHELVEQYPDFIYVNDKHSHKEAIEYKKQYPDSKLILNVQDLAEHCYDHKQIIDDLSINFYQANAVTTISETVKKQMLSTFPHIQKMGVEVIYQPIKPVKPVKRERNGKLLVVGRQNDKNKRFLLALESARLAGMELDIIGSENPILNLKPEYKRYCNYRGLLNDKELNEEYNSHSAVLICSENEGLCLPLVESLVTKTPVVCVSSMITSKEFCPKEFICEQNPFTIAEKIKYVTSGQKEINDTLDEFSIKYIKQFSQESVAFNIIKCYEKIK